MRSLSMHHVGLTTSHFAEMRQFYVDVLGLSVVGGFPGYNIVFLGLGGTMVELLEEAGDTHGPSPQGWNHLALEVADVAAAHRELTARGVPFASPPEDFPPEAPTLRIAFLRDPDGNLVELVQSLGECAGRG